MNEILICTMGYSPGVVTKMTQYLQQKEGRQLSEVWVARTSKQAIGLLFNDIVLKEFQQGGKIQGLTPREKVISPEDTTTAQQVETFADEFAEFLASKMTDGSPFVNLCLSGGRKSMTYAATMAFVKLVAIISCSFSLEDVKNKLEIWHIQLQSEEEFSIKEIEDLRLQYVEAQNITEEHEVEQNKRVALLYPNRVEISAVPFLYLNQLGFNRTSWIVPEERR